MRTLGGWWIQAKTYTDIEKVPVNQEPETVDGAIFIRFDIVDVNKEVYLNATTSKKYSYIIECDFKDKIEQNDRIWVEGRWRKVSSVNEKLPKDKQNIVKTWPGQYQKHVVKTVLLQ